MVKTQFYQLNVATKAAHITCKAAFMEVHIFEEVLSGTAEHAALLL